MLFKDITDVKAVISVSAATSFERLSPFINTVERDYILPVIGNDLYQDIEEYCNTEDRYKITSPDFPLKWNEDMDHDELSHVTAILIWHLQNAVVHLAYHKGFDMLNSYISDGGFKRSETETVKSLFKYQEDHLKNYLHEAGMNAIDTALEWLEQHEDLFPEHGGVFKKMKGRIIPNTRIFNEHYNINNSRLTFMRLQQHMKDVEDLEISPHLGPENLALILSELKKEEPSTKVVTILPYLRNPVAYLSAAMLMEESGADLTHKGLYYTGQRSIANSDYVMPTPEERITALIKRNKEIGVRYLSRLRKYISDNSEEWGGTPNPRSFFHNRDNTGKKILWV